MPLFSLEPRERVSEPSATAKTILARAYTDRANNAQP